MSDEKNLVEWGGWVQGGRISAATPKISAATPISSATPIISAATPIISPATPKFSAATPVNWRGDPQICQNLGMDFPHPYPLRKKREKINNKEIHTLRCHCA